VIRALLTGATGFLGRHCLERLSVEDCVIDAVTRHRRGDEADGGRVYWHQADLRDPEASRRLVTAIRPTHLLHLAWEATPRLYNQSPENLRWLAAGLAMATAFGETGGHRLVGAGTSAEYESGHARCVEDATPIRPATIYAKCKAACWLGIEAAAQHYGFATAWGRVFLPYGPGDPPARLIPSVLAALDAGQPVRATHGRQVRDFIYAPDLADLMVRLLFSGETGAFNIGTGRETTVRSVVEYLADRRGGRDLVQFGTIEPPAGEQAALVADMAKVEAHLGWHAPTSIRAGLDRVLGESREGAGA
jgi:nucleoside-diphosphate-sugar epimerase